MNNTIERTIVIGLITSTDFIQQIEHVYEPRLFEGPIMKRLSKWCMEYYSEYSEAPEKNIETIFLARRGDIPEDLAEDIEEDIFPNLDDQFEEEGFNLEYMVEQTFLYFKQRNLQLFSEEIQGHLLDNNILEAEKLAAGYTTISSDDETTLDLSHKDITEIRVDTAFNRVVENVIEYPGPLGMLWNDQLRRGAFVALMGSEKRGKTFRLLEMSMRAYKQSKRVAFFQAGDMTESEQLVRIGVYLSRRSNNPEYCKQHFEPVKDCYKNQIDDCDLEERECDFGALSHLSEQHIKDYLTLDELKEAYRDNPEYTPCTNCLGYSRRPGYGAPWIKRVPAVNQLTAEEAQAEYNKFFHENRSFKLSSHVNGTLSVGIIRSQLDIWERQEGFIPELIAIDYADILIPETTSDYRHQQNEIWKSLRGLSQERHALVLTATQADAKSYEKKRLTKANFSEDKRKYGHVTAMYGLNQDKDDRESEIGLMRINEIVLREGMHGIRRDVTVLQNLQKGRPFLGSFW